MLSLSKHELEACPEFIEWSKDPSPLVLILTDHPPIWARGVCFLKEMQHACESKT